MDTWLYRGDHKRNEQGFVEKISGGMEKIQQAIIRLSVPKGSFALDEELGSKLSMLRSHFTSGRGRGNIGAMQAS